MYKLVILLAFLALSVCAYILHTANPYSDELEYAEDSTVPVKSASSYKKALQTWKSPEDINDWITANFSYDTARAIRLSETQRTKNESVSIYSPSKFFETKTGVCVDLSRFSVETLRKINPHSDPKYLMIEFDPIQIGGDTFRLHWLVSFRRNGKAYFFSDSKRPGHIAGPYNYTQTFVDEYEQYRGRKIISFRELESYQKQRRTKAMKRQAKKKP
ncbi:MAG: hypothetical protein JSV31_22125 [Desulfobacterales bacterium]|nr:MAG: hypothetical protein JSV31_22125 [Desulfobacterales bacterium]